MEKSEEKIYLEELFKKFPDRNARREIVKTFGTDELQLYSAVNEDGETVMFVIRNDGISTYTYQKNGWVRFNHYGSEGFVDDEMYSGRWKLPSETVVEI